MFNKPKMDKDTGQLRCPKCGCSSFSDQKKGFGLLRGVAGLALGGPVVGLVTGGIGRNKVEVKCIKCGKKWKV